MKASIREIYVADVAEGGAVIGGNTYRTPEAVEGGYLIRPVKGEGGKVVSSLDWQESVYHKEGVLDHVGYVVDQMVSLAPAGLRDAAFIIAVLHDIAKKYTIRLNKNGGACFYGHEALSALLAEKLFSENETFCRLRHLILPVIREHLQLKLLKDERRAEFIDSFRSEHGEKALSLLIIIDEADQGLKEGEDAQAYFASSRRGWELIDSVSFI